MLPGVRPSVRALFTEIIDYAGLFPPAKLPLDQALGNYDRYRQGPDRWMLGRFVCPAASLAELTPFADEIFPPVRPLALVIVGSDEPARDWQALTEVREQFPGRIDVAGYECRWTGHAGWDAFEQLPVFVEVALGANWREAVAEAVAVLASGRRRGLPCGLKLRCGGEMPAAFPSSEQVAHVLATCRKAELPVKFTAGLHHPLRHRDTRLGVFQHGFLNVFAAGVLAHARPLGAHDILRIVEEQDGGRFHFASDRLGWREWSVSVPEMVAARQRLVTSFGSCSFDEPVADLRELGLIGK